MKFISWLLIIGIMGIMQFATTTQAALSTELDRPTRSYSYLIDEVNPPYSLGGSISAWDQQTGIQNLNLKIIPEVANIQVLQTIFNRIRDEKSWIWTERTENPRRLPWVFPSDGCFLRADLMVQKIKEWQYPLPKKLFLFGNLTFTSKYETMNWWYHVAPALRVGEEVYIIDPSLDFSKPLPLKLWTLKVTENLEEVTFALCGAGAVSPEDDCSIETSEWHPDDREATLQRYLGEEWYGLLGFLGEPPENLLGNSPPWT